MILTAEERIVKKRSLFDGALPSSILKIFAIARSTYRESVREKIWLVVLLFGVVIMASSFFLSPLAVGAKQKIILDVGLASISILSVLTAILVGSTLLHKEIEKRAIYLVLTRPVNRFEYLVGKFSGIVATIAVLITVMTIIFLATAYFGGSQINSKVIAAVYFSLLEVALVSSVIVFFSTFTTPVLTSIFTLCLFIAGNLSGDLRTFAQKFGGPAVRWIMDFLYYTLPNFKVFNLRHEAVHDLPFNFQDLYHTTIYAFVYCAAIMYFAYLVFRGREMR